MGKTLWRDVKLPSRRAERIRDFLVENNLNPSELGVAMGLKSRGHVSRMIMGRATITNLLWQGFANVQRIYTLTGRLPPPADEIMTGRRVNPTPPTQRGDDEQNS